VCRPALNLLRRFPVDAGEVGMSEFPVAVDKTITRLRRPEAFQQQVG